MDVDQELEGLIESLKFASAAAHAQQTGPARSELSPRAGRGTPQGSPLADSAADAPIHTRRRETQPPAAPVEIPQVVELRRRSLAVWASAAAASFFMATTMCLGVAFVLPNYMQPPDAVRFANATADPASTSSGDAGRPSPVDVPVRSWTLKDLHDSGKCESSPSMDSAEHERLKGDLRNALRRNGYLPSSYTLPKTAPQERGGTSAVRFASKSS